MENFIHPDRFLEVWHTGHYEEVYAATSRDFQQFISLTQFLELCRSFCEGTPIFELEKIADFQGVQQYIWVDQAREKAMVAAFNQQHQIQSFYLKPFVQFPQSDQRYTHNIYQMPIVDEWFVFWGGTNEFVNYHYAYENQRYAYDLVKRKDGLTYKKNATRNEHFYAFGKKVVAPAAGRVVTIVDGLPDQIPGEMNEQQPAGNYIILAHEHNEYSMIAHFKQNSIVVNEGEVVMQGQLLGQCGNSGNSSEPHIHFHVMDSKDWTQAKSIRIRLEGAEPVQGDVTKPEPLLKERLAHKIDRVDDTWTIIELLLIIPRAIARYF